MFSKVKTAARGHWPDILESLGVDRSKLTNIHQPCPACGGTDRFRFDDKNGDGTFICSGGGGSITAGDGFKLLIHCLIAKDNREALHMVAKRVL